MMILQHCFKKLNHSKLLPPEQLLEQGSSLELTLVFNNQSKASRVCPRPPRVWSVSETEVAAPAQLAQGSSSGINKYVLSYPREFARLQERGTQHAQEVIAAQGMPEQQQELEQSWSLQVSPQFHEPAAQEHAVMAAQDMPLPQQPQQVELGGHAPPDVPPSLQNKITRCSKRFEMHWHIVM
ncbi:hypothetical protein L3X38_040115 [Prunus dulcis]|uniref:Uncharacterized protein n=1 Tax=Prunus dulcis TaxID=3755 RepID=A0AAD4YS41_PRUDU|nr:hypothetical protein L3X38_040115 [Prunus dulcis]